MATGAGDRYWGERALPSVFKHTLLDKYVPQFAGMTVPEAPVIGLCSSTGTQAAGATQTASQPPPGGS